MSYEHTRRSRVAAEILDRLYVRAVTRYLEAPLAAMCAITSLKQS